MGPPKSFLSRHAEITGALAAGEDAGAEVKKSVLVGEEAMT